MQTRRVWLGGLVATLAAPSAASAASVGGNPVLERAMLRAGGRDVLAEAAVLRWKGQAKIFTTDRMIEIGVSTIVRPFRAARSDSWLLSEGPEKRRSMIIEGDEGWLERDGKREPMPARMLAHERAQFAIYGLMLLAPLRERGATAEPAEPRDGLQCLMARHPDAPPTLLCFDGEARLARALNRVPSPDSDAVIEQRFDFTGEIRGGGVRWPQRLAIAQDGKPYFELELAHFDAESDEPELRSDARTGDR